MRPSPRSALAGLVLLALSTTEGARAATFPDVPETHSAYESVEFLVARGAIHGNPDGRFHAERSVNRAELLKVLYLTAGITPNPVFSNRFPDVEAGGWYEFYIGDAAHRGFIQGFADGTFRPYQAVTRAEATKMILVVLGVTVPRLDEKDLLSLGFIDVSPFAWYARYLHRAATLALFPPGFLTEKEFFPTQPLLRGEAAQIIHATLLRGSTPPPEGEEPSPRPTPSRPELRPRDDYGTEDARLTPLFANLTGKLEAAGDADAFALNLKPGQSVEVVVRITEGDPRLTCSADILSGADDTLTTVSGTRNHCTIRIYEPTAGRAKITIAAPAESQGSSYAVTVIEKTLALLAPTPEAVAFPFDLGSTRKRASYTFPLTSPAVVAITVELTGSRTGSLRCTLYLLTEGYTHEYYEGHEEGARCSIRAAVSPGDYQVDVEASGPFSTTASASTGDSNDGLREAKSLLLRVPRTSSLTANDYQDWYRFSLSMEATLSITLSTQQQLGCSILPSATVDLPSLTSPSCNSPYDFPAGTYYVVIKRARPAATLQAYTVELR